MDTMETLRAEIEELKKNQQTQFSTAAQNASFINRLQDLERRLQEMHRIVSTHMKEPIRQVAVEK